MNGRRLKLTPTFYLQSSSDNRGASHSRVLAPHRRLALVHLHFSLRRHSAPRDYCNKKGECLSTRTLSGSNREVKEVGRMKAFNDALTSANLPGVDVSLVMEAERRADNGGSVHHIKQWITEYCSSDPKRDRALHANAEQKLRAFVRSERVRSYVSHTAQGAFFSFMLMIDSVEPIACFVCAF